MTNINELVYHPNYDNMVSNNFSYKKFSWKKLFSAGESTFRENEF